MLQILLALVLLGVPTLVHMGQQDQQKFLGDDRPIDGQAVAACCHQVLPCPMVVKVAGALVSVLH